MFAFAQRLHSFGVGGIDHQVETTETLACENAAVAEIHCRCRNGVVGNNGLAVCVEQTQGGTALRAGIGLCVKATVARIGVFSLACGTHLERRHGRLRTVVGQGAQNGEARSAVGAIGESVTLSASLANIEEALCAGREVCLYEHGLLAAVRAVTDLKTLVTHGVNVDCHHSSQHGCRRDLLLKVLQKDLQAGFVSFYLYGDTTTVVEDPTRKPRGSREPINERTEANALNSALNSNSATLSHWIKGKG